MSEDYHPTPRVRISRETWVELKRALHATLPADYAWGEHDEISLEGGIKADMLIVSYSADERSEELADWSASLVWMHCCGGLFRNSDESGEMRQEAVRMRGAERTIANLIEAVRLRPPVN